MGVVLGSESLVDAWGSDHFHHHHHNHQHHHPLESHAAHEEGTETNPASSESATPSASSPESPAASPSSDDVDSPSSTEKETETATATATAGTAPSQIIGCSEYLDVLAKEHYTVVGNGVDIDGNNINNTNNRHDGAGNTSAGPLSSAT